MLEFGVRNCAGFTVITREIGSGKTTLIHYLLGRLDRSVVGRTDFEYAARLRWLISVGDDGA
jgi:type IV secretory pathway VirB4 component